MKALLTSGSMISGFRADEGTARHGGDFAGQGSDGTDTGVGSGREIDLVGATLSRAGFLHLGHRFSALWRLSRGADHRRGGRSWPWGISAFPRGKSRSFWRFSQSIPGSPEGGRFWDAWRRRRLAYGVTDRRVVLASTARITSIDPAKVTAITFEDHGPRPGNDNLFAFGWRDGAPSWPFGRPSPPSPRFDRIDGARTVHDLIQKLKASQLPNRTLSQPTADNGNGPPNDDPPSELVDRSHPGEALSWWGRPFRGVVFRPCGLFFRSRRSGIFRGSHNDERCPYRRPSRGPGHSRIGTTGILDLHPIRYRCLDPHVRTTSLGCMATATDRLWSHRDAGTHRAGTPRDKHRPCRSSRRDTQTAGQATGNDRFRPSQGLEPVQRHATAIQPAQPADVRRDREHASSL